MKYKLAMRAKKPEQRLRTFLGFCQPKKECPYTNAPQPTYRMDGMKIMMEFPKPKADDDLPPEQADRKQVLSCSISLTRLHHHLHCLRGDTMSSAISGITYCTAPC